MTELLTPREAAIRLNCSVKILRAHVAAGAFATCRSGSASAARARCLPQAILKSLLQIKNGRTFHCHVRLQKSALAVLAIRLPAPG